MNGVVLLVGGLLLVAVIFKFKGKIKILSPKECITEMQQIAQEFI